MRTCTENVNPWSREYIDRPTRPYLP